ncbi:MAG: 1,4-dihydroxy-2-naphthoyl-CoA synthase [Chloroflexi bacterium]|nr:1,4-dihydroxy-2-naphthoyl-CoA synthase [Chloroflexota bacterium]
MTEFQDIRYDKENGVARITINRPEVYNAFTTNTVREIAQALEDAGLDPDIGVVVLTGAGDKAFCTGGDLKEAAQPGGYSKEMDYWHSIVHQRIRNIPKPVIAAVNGYAIGGGHILHLICDLSIASENARFGQAGPRVGSFDAGFGASYLARVVGEKKAREIWFLCRQYTAQEALAMGLVNKVVPFGNLEEEVDKWCQEILALSPTALKFCKLAFNAETDHMFGFDKWSEAAVRMFWDTKEAEEAKTAFMERRKPDFSQFR